MRRTVFHASVLLLVVALGLLAYRHALDDVPEGGGTLTALSPDRDLGRQPCGEWVTVRFRFENSSSHAIPVFGLVSGCGKNSCFGPKQPNPFTVPAGGEVEIECEAIAYEPGDFHCPMSVNWFHEGEYRMLKLAVCGIGVDPKDKSHASKTP